MGLTAAGLAGLLGTLTGIVTVFVVGRASGAASLEEGRKKLEAEEQADLFEDVPALPGSRGAGDPE